MKINREDFTQAAAKPTCDECGAVVDRIHGAVKETEPVVILAYELFPCGHNARCTIRPLVAP